MFRNLFLFLSISFSLSTYASNGWQKIAHSHKGCGEKFEIYAKKGEKYLKLKSEEKVMMLNSIDQQGFSEESPYQQRYISTHEEYEYVQPSIIDGNLARLKIKNNKIENCKMISISN
jgi:hypothetical protein